MTKLLNFQKFVFNASVKFYLIICSCALLYVINKFAPFNLVKATQHTLVGCLYILLQSGFLFSFLIFFLIPRL